LIDESVSFCASKSGHFDTLTFKLSIRHGPHARVRSPSSRSLRVVYRSISARFGQYDLHNGGLIKCQKRLVPNEPGSTFYGFESTNQAGRNEKCPST